MKTLIFYLFTTFILNILNTYTTNTVTPEGTNRDGLINEYSLQDIDTQSISNQEFIKIEKISTDTILDSQLDIRLTYNSINIFYKHIIVHGLYKDVFGHEVNFYNTNIAVDHIQGSYLDLKIELPEDIVYYDYQNLLQPTNFYASDVQISAFLLDHEEKGPFTYLMLLDKVSDSITIPLLSPWYRNDRPRYSINWELYLTKLLKWKFIPTCQLLFDAPVFSSMLALPGSDVGFTGQLNELNWPSHVLPYIRRKYAPMTRFSLSFWMFVAEECFEGMCIILQHRDRTHFFTPLIMLNHERNLHIQLHSNDGGGQAFATSEPIQLKTWIYVMLSVNENVADLYMTVPNSKKIKHYYHVASQPIYCNETDGLWVVGGYLGSYGIKGLIAQVNIYRKQYMRIDTPHNIPEVYPYTSIQNVKYISVEKKRFEDFDFNRLLKVCDLWKSVIWRHVFKNLHSKSCCYSLMWWEYKKSIKRTSPLIKDLVRKEIKKHIIHQLKYIFRNKFKTSISLHDFGKLLYNMTMKDMLKTSLPISLISQLFEISGCLGNSIAYHTVAMINTYGLGVPVNRKKALQMHYLGALNNGALSQLALVYRHQLQMDNLSSNSAVVIGYLHQAAVTVNKCFQEEKQAVYTQSEMIRLDQAHSFSNVRGTQSELFKWLSQQAKMGSSNARTEVAEMLFHGKQGVGVNRGESRQLYEIGAAEGDPHAMYNLGVMHLKGINTAPNEMKAVELFEKAAALNFSAAFNSLGYIEIIHKQNRSGAAHYWKKASDRGNFEATTNYASLLEGGLHPGDRPDLVGAYKHYELAASQGQKVACVKVAIYLTEGVIVERDLTRALQFLKFVTDQLDDIGVCLRNAVDSYLDNSWYSSLVNFLLATEAGVQLAGYNTALLLNEYKMEAAKSLVICDPYHYYNLTAELGWSLSMIAMGHYNWYGKSCKTNKYKASEYYARSVKKDNNPEALYNLGYIIEHGYPIHSNTDLMHAKNNLTAASLFYKNCMKSTSESKEGYYPCQIALFKVHLKRYLSSTIGITYLPLGLVTISLTTVAAFTYIIYS